MTTIISRRVAKATALSQLVLASPFRTSAYSLRSQAGSESSLGRDQQNAENGKPVRFYEYSFMS